MDNKKKFKMIILVLGLIVIVTIIIVVKIYNKGIEQKELEANKEPEKVTNMPKEEYKKIKEQVISEGKTEQEAEKMMEVLQEEYLSPEEDFEHYKLEYTVTNIYEFFEHIKKKNYKEAYELLLPDYKNSAFETLESFEKYCKNNFMIDDTLREYDINNIEAQDKSKIIVSISMKNKDGVYETVKVTVTFREGHKNKKSYYISFNEFEKQETINKSSKVSPNCNITFVKTERYKNKAVVTLKIENETKYDVTIGDSKKTQVDQYGNKYQTDVVLNVKLNGRDFADIANITKYGKYTVKAGTTSELKFDFPTAGKAVLQNIELKHIMIDKVYDAKINVN